ncbi:MAG: aspartyl protease family protein [Bacteroidota bacterium]
MIKFIMMMIGFVLTLNEVSAQRFEFPGRRKKEVVPFKMVKNLMIIKLVINGKGPFNFVLDTGVGLFLISDPKLIDSLSIKNLRSINITGFGDGEPLSAFVTPSIDVEFGSTTAKALSAAILKKDIFELSNYVGMPVHGLIGYEFFNSFIVKINFTLSTLTVYKPETTYIPRKGYRVPLMIEDRKPYLVSNIELTSGEKIPAKLILDTGAGHPISLETNGGVPFEVPKTNIAGNLGIGLTGPISGYISRVKSLTLGKYTLNNVIAAFPDYDDVGSKVYSVSRNGNMGITILKRFNVIFDYNESALYIKPGIVLNEPFEHDMSGLELTSAGAKFDRVLVSRVEPGSSADEAGLRKDDEILAINFKPVSEMSPSEIDNMFRSKSDRSFILDVLPITSKNTRDRERVILTLKRRI